MIRKLIREEKQKMQLETFDVGTAVGTRGVPSDYQQPEIDMEDSMDISGNRSDVQRNIYSDYGHMMQDFMDRHGNMIRHHNLWEEVFAEMVRQAKENLELE